MKSVFAICWSQLLIVCVFASNIELLPEYVNEKCYTKFGATDVVLSCNYGERIAIHEAFFTTSAKFRCPHFSSQPLDLLSDEHDSLIYPRPPLPCTDDLRLSFNRKCSASQNCTFNLTRDHNTECFARDGFVVLKYTCVAEDKFHPYCNSNLTGNYGYVTTPGYPAFYPPYGECIWSIKESEGQIIQIKILDVAIKEPRVTTSGRRTHFSCTDRLIISEDNTKIHTLCGENETNLIQFRSKSNLINLEFSSSAFSPTRGVLFRYSAKNCPTISAPKNGHLVRNGSFAFYNCCENYVFEDSRETDLVLHCEFGGQWNGTVAKCVSKDSFLSASLHAHNESDIPTVRANTSKLDSLPVSDIIVPIVLMVVLLVGNAIIVCVLFHYKRKQKMNRMKTTEFHVPLNSTRPTDV